MFDPNSWMLEEMTIRELWDGMEENAARLEDAIKKEAFDLVDEVVQTIVQLEKELIKRGVV